MQKIGWVPSSGTDGEGRRERKQKSGSVVRLTCQLDFKNAAALVTDFSRDAIGWQPHLSVELLALSAVVFFVLIKEI